LKLQIGPVQEFIAQARSTRDLWSGSYLLSWLMAAGIAELVKRLEAGGRSRAEAKAALIFPHLGSASEGSQPMVELMIARDARDKHQPVDCLTPSLPNIFVALVPQHDAATAAKAVHHAITNEWKMIADACWKRLQDDGLVPANRARFDHQIERFLSISWQITPFAADYEKASIANAMQLDAVRQTRAFAAWSSSGWTTGKLNEKDSLTGREEAVCGGREWWHTHIEPKHKIDPMGYWPTLFRERQAGDYYSAITLVKRLWHREYLGVPPWSYKVAKQLPIPSTWQAANHDPNGDGDDAPGEPAPDDKRYFAVLAMDGDKMGEWLSGAKNLRVSEAARQCFSSALGYFAVKEARGIVQKHHGCLIYAGGDDVLALLPADTALDCARELREKFREVLKGKIPAEYLKPSGSMNIDASTGIAIAHFAFPLQDVVKAAKAAEKRAKRSIDQGGMNRSAVAVTLFKRSGEITEWGCGWDDRGLPLFEAVLKAMEADLLSAKFPHRVIELLEAYRTNASPLVEEAKTFVDAPGFVELVDELISREFAHALSRQHGQGWEVNGAGAKAGGELIVLLKDHLNKLSEGKPNNLPLTPQAKLRRVTGLLTAVAFAARTAADNKNASAERQSA
jgi:CRISPR-associated protein Cmr2